MRKSFFSILLCFILIPFTISAISLSEIENDPIRYVKVYEVMDETGCYYTGSMYVDKDSVEVLLCAPPLYQSAGKHILLTTAQLFKIQELLITTIISLWRQ